MGARGGWLKGEGFHAPDRWLLLWLYVSSLPEGGVDFRGKRPMTALLCKGWISDMSPVVPTTDKHPPPFRDKTTIFSLFLSLFLSLSYFYPSLYMYFFLPFSVSFFPSSLHGLFSFFHLPAHVRLQSTPTWYNSPSSMFRLLVLPSSLSAYILFHILYPTCWFFCSVYCLFFPLEIQ